MYSGRELHALRTLPHALLQKVFVCSVTRVRAREPRHANACTPASFLYSPSLTPPARARLWHDVVRSHSSRARSSPLRVWSVSVCLALFLTVVMGRGGGNDGGILAVKRYLIRTAAVDTSAAARAKVQAACRTRSCALSGEALMPPCVSDMLGRVYNKMAVCEYLLQAASGGKRPGFENLRSLSKDTFNLVLTRNDAGDAAPTRTGTKITAVSTTATDALFVCPVTQAPANGAIPFVALRKCGCAMSERALREIKGEACPACGAAFANADVVRLWPSEEELELARARLLAQKRERAAPVKIARALAP
ncbi:hypothetical protein EON67_01480, partial [archaeon]